MTTNRNSNLVHQKIETAILCQLRLRKGSLNHSDRTWSICHHVLAHTAKQHPANHITLFSFNQTGHNNYISERVPLIIYIYIYIHVHIHTLLSKFNILKSYVDNKRLIEFYIWSTGIGITLIILSRMWSSIWRRKPNNNFPEYFPPQFYAHVRYAIRCLMRSFIGFIYKSRFFFLRYIGGGRCVWVQTPAPLYNVRTTWIIP